MAKKKFPRVTQIRLSPSSPSFLEWQCNRCFGWTDAKNAWIHDCGPLCSCGHAAHDPKRCEGKVISTWSSWVRHGCHCKEAAPSFQI